MFFTYLRRELRRRMRQAIFVALGLALGIGLVITVVAASKGVQHAQSAVLRSLYGVGTDVTVTSPPKSSSTSAVAIGLSEQARKEHGGVLLPGDKININELFPGSYGLLSTADLLAIARQHGVTNVAGGLLLTDFTVTGSLPKVSLTPGQDPGNLTSHFKYSNFTVAGVSVADRVVGPLSSAKVISGREFTPADARADEALVDSNYAAQHKLSVGGKVSVGGTAFTIAGVVQVPQGGSPPDVYIPLAMAQAVGKNGSHNLSGSFDAVYVAAASAADIATVQKEISQAIPSVVVTDQNDLASEVTGSLSNASSLANNLGKWLAIAVLAAAFLLASLLTVAAVSRRVREFGTLKALGWRSFRIIRQVLGESVVVGIIGGAIGVGLGFGGAALIDRLAPKLTATIGSTNAPSATARPGGLLKSLIATTHTVSVPLSAPVTSSVIGLAVALAVTGGIVAGVFGGWRAARLRPAAALAKVE